MITRFRSWFARRSRVARFFLMVVYAIAGVPALHLLLFGGTWARALPGALGVGLALGWLAVRRERPPGEPPASVSR